MTKVRSRGKQWRSGTMDRSNRRMNVTAVSNLCSSCCLGIHLDLKWSEDETMQCNNALLSQSTFYTLASSIFMNDDMSERPSIRWSFRIKCIRLANSIVTLDSSHYAQAVSFIFKHGETTKGFKSSKHNKRVSLRSPKKFVLTIYVNDLDAPGKDKNQISVLRTQ